MSASAPLALAAEKTAAGLMHGAMETQQVHVDVRLARVLALLAQLAAPPADPCRGLFKFLGR